MCGRGGPQKNKIGGVGGVCQKNNLRNLVPKPHYLMIDKNNIDQGLLIVNLGCYPKCHQLLHS